MVVMKFGGTSVADRAAIERLMAIVRRQRAKDAASAAGVRGPVVVVSALSGVTDRLLGVAAQAGAGDAEGARHNLRELRARHLTVAEVVTDEALRAAVSADIDTAFDELERVVEALGGAARGVAALARHHRRYRRSREQPDRGRRPGRARIAGRVGRRAPGRRDRRRAHRRGPLVSRNHGGLGRAHAGSTLAAGRIPVMGGFVGATRRGRHHHARARRVGLFRRPSSARCLDADEIQIWTDVDGMLTADPRIVKAPRVVPHLSFAEASELAYFGAKVLHPATIQPAVARNIPVRILNSQRAEAPGTLITAERPPSDGTLTALASKKQVTVVDITSTRMLMAHGFLRRLFEVFERYKTPVDVVTTSEVSVSVTVDDRAPPAGNRGRAVGVRRRVARARHGHHLRRRRRAAAGAGAGRPGAAGGRATCR